MRLTRISGHLSATELTCCSVWSQDVGYSHSGGGHGFMAPSHSQGRGQSAYCSGGFTWLRMVLWCWVSKCKYFHGNEMLNKLWSENEQNKIRFVLATTRGSEQNNTSVISSIVDPGKSKCLLIPSDKKHFQNCFSSPLTWILWWVRKSELLK